MISFRGTLKTILLCAFACPIGAHAQQTVTLAGVVTDPSGAVIPNASVVLHPATGPDTTVTTARNGHYAVSPSPSSSPDTQYTVIVNAQGFAPYVSEPLKITASQTLDVRLKIESADQQIEVSDNAMDTDPAHNGDSIVLKGNAIDELPLDPTELQQELTALAGGDSPEFYVNGFSGGTLPPRDTIREIRINQNPYSAQYDTNPVNGLIQIFTKPGSDKYHFDLFSYGNADFLNTRNPFVSYVPPYHSLNVFSSFSGPVTKHISFFLNGGFADSETNSIVNGEILDSGNNEQNFTQAVPSSSLYKSFNSRIDSSLGKHSTLTVSYSINSSKQNNGGVGQFALATQGYDNNSTNQTLQISNSQILTTHIVNDTRFQYQRSRVSQKPYSLAPSLVVQGAFTGGGNNGGAYNDNQDRYELQNYVSQDHGKQYFTYGGRLRSGRDANHSTANYNGEYIFATLAAYQTAEQALAAGATSVSGASQFLLSTGNPNIAVSVTDLGLFFQDDWKARPNLTLSGGLRFESQNRISDHDDWAPRLGFAWNLPTPKGKPAKYILRGGAGIFYKRFTSGYVLQAERQNGLTQQEYIVANPATFPNIPTVATLGAQQPSTTYQISPVFRSPYLISSTIGVERRLGNAGSITVTYLNMRGVHTQITRNINAPLPGTYVYGGATSGTRPLGTAQNIYEYESAGVYRGNRLSANFNLRFKKKYNLYGFYQYRDDKSDDNNGGFPSNSYNLGADYGRASTVARHQLNMSAGFQLPFGFNNYTYIRATSGMPFNILVGQDLNGDSQFNDRPAFATDLTRASVIKTAFGNFDTLPIAGQTIIPINYGMGPAFVSFNTNFGRNFSFGPVIKPPPGAPVPKLAPGEKPRIDHRYSLSLSIDAQNIFNHPNLAPPVGTLNSPLFGKSTSLASSFSSSTANRIISLQTYFRF